MRKWFVVYHYGPGLKMAANDKTYRSFNAAFEWVWSQIRDHGGLSKKDARAHLAEGWDCQVCTPPHGDGYSIDCTRGKA
jgi:hypothetical protein